MIGLPAHTVNSSLVTLESLVFRVVERLPEPIAGRLRGPGGQKLWRYSVASLVAVIVSEICLILFNGVVGLSAAVASSFATSIAAIPNYYMNRKWAWGKHGRSHLLKEVVPFWALAFAGWALSTYSVYLMEHYAKHHQFSHALTTALVAIVYIAAFGILWIGKFIIFNKLMFVHRHHQTPDEPQAVTLSSGGSAGVRVPG
jgi:putative flippase GtrA